MYTLRQLAIVATLWLTFGAGLATAQAVPEGAPFTVNTSTAGDQELPAVTATPDGGFAVVWITREDGLEGVNARVLDPLGQPLGDDIVLEAPQGEDLIRWPRIEARGEDEIVAAWFQHPGPPQLSTSDDVQIRRFYPDGIILGDLESPPEDVTNQLPLEHDLAAFDDGSLVITWRQGADDFITGAQIYARVYDPAGAAGLPFVVNPTLDYEGEQAQPAVATGGGEFVVVWSGTGLGFRRYDAGGEALGPEEFPPGFPPGREPRVAADAGGNFVMTWTVHVRETASFDVWAQRFTHRGATERPMPGQPFRVHGIAGNQQAPDIAMDAAGNFVIVWRTDLDGEESLVEGRLFTRFGGPAGNRFTIAQGAAPDARPSVALTDAGTFQVVWHAAGVDGEGTGIAGQRYQATFRSCVEDARSLCLQQDRFHVDVRWHDFRGATGRGHPVSARSADSGLFWFFSPSNWEIMVKVLDGCDINRFFWVFAAATTNVEYTLTVTDTITGEVREYHNPLGVSSPAITDTAALDTCSAAP